MKEPFISICMPAYRAERYLEPTLDSVRAQTYQHWELIVVEDGSHDSTQALVNTFAARVSQPVRYLRHPENRGLPATRNTGIEAACGDWIALLDSDDLWLVDHLESLVETMNQNEADLVHAGSILFQSETGKFIQERVPTPQMTASFPHSLFCGDYIIQPASVLLRRSLWRKVGGFDPAFRYVEDRDMWLRCARAGARFVYTGKQSCLYRKHGTALSTHAAEMAEASAAVFDKHLDWDLIPREVRRRLAAETWAAAGRLRQRRDPSLASRHFQRACAVDWRLDWWLRRRLHRRRFDASVPASPGEKYFFMNVTLCTLFEGDYHLGAAALLNSLHHAGFTGTFVCGHRGPRPPWARRTANLAPLRVVWAEVSVPVHLTNYKPTFMLACLQSHTPSADCVGYLDPDIIVKAPWPVLDRWMRGGGVTLCEDVNPYLPSGHPYRFAWHDFFSRHGLVPVRTLERYYNAGFIAVPRAHENLLLTWEHLIALASRELGPLDRIKHGRPGTLFHTIDQDAMNMALLLHQVPIFAAGGEAMDFLPGGHLLSHATGGRKPWRGGFLRDALLGQPPGLAQKQFYHHAETPLPVLSAPTLAWRRFELGLAALLGRIYRRT